MEIIIRTYFNSFFLVFLFCLECQFVVEISLNINVLSNNIGKFYILFNRLKCKRLCYLKFLLLWYIYFVEINSDFNQVTIKLLVSISYESNEEDSKFIESIWILTKYDVDFRSFVILALSRSLKGQRLRMLRLCRILPNWSRSMCPKSLKYFYLLA
jgi:hypothetical protein